jgi:hypothetical protein
MANTTKTETFSKCRKSVLAMKEKLNQEIRADLIRIESDDKNPIDKLRVALLDDIDTAFFQIFRALHLLWATNEEKKCNCVGAFHDETCKFRVS